MSSVTQYTVPGRNKEIIPVITLYSEYNVIGFCGQFFSQFF